MQFPVCDFFITAKKMQQPFKIVAFIYIKKDSSLLETFNEAYLETYIIQVLVDRRTFRVSG